jgi:hypothetical protein
MILKNITALLVTFTLALLINTGCEPELVTSIELPEEDPKLAVSAFLIAGDTMHVLLLGGSQPNNTTNNQDPFVKNGVVKLIHGTDSIPLINLGDGLYGFSSSMLPIVPGGTYTLYAFAPGYEKAITATCTIPGSFDPQFQFKSVEMGKPSEWGIPYNVEISFTDIAGSSDYYRVFAYANVERTGQFGEHDTVSLMMYSPESQPQLIKDAGKDGNTFPMKLSFELPTYEGETFKLLSLDFTILRTDEAYYKFNYPFVVQGYYEDSPFGEPTVIYSNVSNGYGVLAGAVRWSQRITI